MELRVGDLVRHIGGIPDYGVGIVLEEYVSDPSRHCSASIPNPYREVRVYWQVPHGYVVWVGNHTLEKVEIN